LLLSVTNFKTLRLFGRQWHGIHNACYRNWSHGWQAELWMCTWTLTDGSHVAWDRDFREQSPLPPRRSAVPS